MRIRLTGTPAEYATGIEHLRAADWLTALTVSGSYTNRGDQLVRIYLTAEITDQRQEAQR
jgi:hypothetical protein